MTLSVDAFSLKGKVAIVTGAGGRGNSIGRAYARALAAYGASVIAADINGDGADYVADEIGGNALGGQVDITDRASVARLVETTRDAFGGVDILVNNAALMVEMRDTTLGISLESWNRALAVNLTGALLCAQACVPLMKARGGGKIVNQMSGGAYPAGGVYGITKIAVGGLTTALAKELGPHNINVNAIAPGMVKSDAGLSLTPDDSPFVKLVAMQATLRPRGEPDDLCGPLLLLVSPAGSWMTGQILNVDGGWIMRA